MKISVKTKERYIRQQWINSPHSVINSFFSYKKNTKPSKAFKSLFFLLSGCVKFIWHTVAKSDMIQEKCNLPRHIHHKQLLWKCILQLIHSQNEVKGETEWRRKKKMHTVSGLLKWSLLKCIKQPKIINHIWRSNPTYRYFV